MKILRQKIKSVLKSLILIYVYQLGRQKKPLVNEQGAEKEHKPLPDITQPY